MSQDNRENLSAGIDGELSKEELRFLLRRLDHDASLQLAWDRYHVMRDGLRRQVPSLASAGFAERVMLAIEQESAPAAAGRRHWLRWSAGGAIAASVAAAALMMVQPTGDPERGASLTAQTASVPSQTASATTQPSVPAAVPPWLSGNAAGMLSQRASATLGEPAGGGLSPYAGHSSPYAQLRRYRTLDNHDGSYLLLLDPGQQSMPAATTRRAAVAQ